VDAQSVVAKTDKGEQEVAKRSGALSLAQRRLLILADGKRDAETIGRMVAAGNYLEILNHLAAEGFVQPCAPAPAKASAKAPEPAQRDETSPNTEAQEFMLNALSSYARSVRNQDLARAIGGATTQQALRLQIEPWYHAIAENPDAMPVVDGLRDQLLKLLAKSAGRG